jgi:diguanylate cyclase (GGDEF)-like protein
MERAAAAAPPTVPARMVLAPAARALLGLLLLAAAAVAMPALGDHHGSAGWGAFAVLAPLTIIAAFLDAPLGSETSAKILTAPLVAAALLLPPALLVVCGALAAFERPRRDLFWQHRAFNASSHVLAVLAAWGMAGLMRTAVGSLSKGAGPALAGVAATAAFAGTTIVVLAAMLWASGEREGIGPLFSGYALLPELALGAVGTSAAVLWTHDLEAVVPLALLPLALVYRSFWVPTLREQARVDAKTGLLNARYFNEALGGELARAQRARRPLALLLADLDFLREVNNTHGHLVGDEVLAAVGETLRAGLRGGDLAGRFGGEEFCVVLPDTDVDRAERIADRLRTAVAARRFAGGETTFGITVSIGVAVYPRHASDQRGLVQAADDAVYAAKAAGRDRVRRAV